MFLPNIIKIDPHNFELYRFKVGSFFRDTVWNIIYYLNFSGPITKTVAWHDTMSLVTRVTLQSFRDQLNSSPVLLDEKFC